MMVFTVFLVIVGGLTLTAGFVYGAVWLWGRLDDLQSHGRSISRLFEVDEEQDKEIAALRRELKTLTSDLRAEAARISALVERADRMDGAARDMGKRIGSLERIARWPSPEVEE